MTRPRPAPRVHLGFAGLTHPFGPLVAVACAVDTRAERAALACFGDGAGRSPDARARRLRAVMPYEVVAVGPRRFDQLYAKMKGEAGLVTWALAKATRGLLAAYPACRALDSPAPELVEPLEAALEKTGGELAIRVAPPRHPGTQAAAVLAAAEFRRRLARGAEQAGVEVPADPEAAAAWARDLHPDGEPGKMTGFAKQVLLRGLRRD